MPTRPVDPSTARAGNRITPSGAPSTAPFEPVEPTPASTPRTSALPHTPLSSAQRALWLLDRMHPGSSQYNVPLAMRLRGPLDADALASALTRLAERHEILRTVFPLHGDEPYQRVRAEAHVPVEYVDLTGVPVGERDAACAAEIRRRAEEPFDLAAGPLLRASLVRTGAEEQVFGLFLHHIVCDGPSLHLLFDELDVFYRQAIGTGRDGTGAGEGGDAGLRVPRLAAQFADYAVKQREWAADERGIAWWLEHLAGAPSTLALPTDHPRPAVRSGRGATHCARLTGALVAECTALARRERATPFLVMTAAYAALLSRLTGARDLLVGTPVAGRSETEYEPLIGPFVNTVPLRVDLSGDPAFTHLVRRVRTATLQAAGHAGIPFETLVDRLRVARDPAVPPLVQAMLTFESEPLARPRLAGVDSELLQLFTDTAKFDFDLMIVKSADGSGDYDCCLTYDTDLFEAATVAAFCERFQALLTAVTRDPELPLHRLPLLTEAEARAAATEWNPEPAPRTAPLPPVHEQVAEQARIRPTAPAVSVTRAPGPGGERDAAGVEVTYAELDRRADDLARRLRAEGAGPGTVIGILLPRGAHLVTALLGVLKSGAAYTPLDVTHPAGHLARVTELAAVRHVLTDTENAARLRDLPVRPLLMDEPDAPDQADGADRADGTDQVIGTDGQAPGDLAYAIFTSGSTGVPKGVAVPHSALANHAIAVRDRFALTADDRVLQFAAAAFDVAAEEILPTLAAGGCVLPSPEPPPPAAELTGLLDAASATVANLPASYWQRWTAAIAGGTATAPITLRLLVVGSEPVDPAALATWSQYTGIPVINAYGLTETTITSLTHTTGDVPLGRPVPVGTPIDGVRAYVLDGDLQQLPPGATGELFIGGAGLARGYLGAPATTADRFLPDPFAPGPGARMHRTGDLARRHPDGTLEVVGRIDEQLKVRGYRIEPGGVEAALCTHPDVVQAAVTARPGSDGTPRLAGYVVTRSGAVPEDLRAHLAGRLPVHLVPGVLTHLPSLPLSTSGKVDRKALPDPAPAAPATTAGPAAVPGTDLERFLAGTWQDVLDLERVGIHDNFFDLGGTSFTLATVHGRLSDRLGRRLPLVSLYEHPTISALAGHLGTAGQDTAPSADRSAAADRLAAGRSRLGQRRRGRT
ncbi:non-ribosomal peptide synthetase [Streptomyces montanisoli]|uniref:Amino acid adenylation domain-containing protein n=1 Tax=Streptomyces montanisoli TaxID=2798581 RepID=A0A940M9K4_9ACTN|nr:non-ribosomal peptide synthetase [Streptomyces montanisoli]MBP0456868.1 amino acid adenylation domain-containing protein [Streptomyces montanisoli]